MKSSTGQERKQTAQLIAAPPLLLYLQHLPERVDLHVQSHLNVQQALVILQLAEHLTSHVQQLLVLLLKLPLPNISLAVHSPLQILATGLQHHFLMVKMGQSIKDAEFLNGL